MRNLSLLLIVTSLGAAALYLVNSLDGSSEPGPVEPLSEAEMRYVEPFQMAGSAKAQASHIWDGGVEDEDLPSRRSWDLMRMADPRTGRIPPDIHRREQEFARHLPQRRESVLFEASGLSKVDPEAGWQSRGPWNVGGRTRALAIDISDPTYQTLLAGGASGGMWRSTDDGASWTLQTGSSQLHSVSCIVQDIRAGHENVWYYGTGEWWVGFNGAHWDWYYGDGIFKSVDGGQTWALLPATSGSSPTAYSDPFQRVHRLAIDPSNAVEDEVYAATRGHIMRSVDGGESFQSALDGFGPPAPMWTDVTVSSTGVVYAAKGSDYNSPGISSGIYRSTDGLAWTEIQPSTWTPFHRAVLAIAPSDENTLYCMIEADPIWVDDVRLFKYTYVSGDGTGSGGIWEARLGPSAQLPVGTDLTVVETQQTYNMLLAVHPTSSDVVYLGARRLWRSTDGFATTDQIAHIGGIDYPSPEDYIHQWDMHSLVFRPGSDVVAYTGSDVGVHKTLDAIAVEPAWENLNHGYITTQHYTVYLDEDAPGSLVVAGGMQDSGTWTTFTDQNDVDWFQHGWNDGGYGGLYDTTEAIGTHFLSWQNGPIIRMKIDNQTGAWISGTQCQPADAGGYLFINPYLVDPVDHRILYMATSNGIWRNNDHTDIPEYSGGPVMINWEHLTPVPASQYISALDVSRTAGRVLYYGTANGTVWKLEDAATIPAGLIPTQLHMGPDFTAGSYVSGTSIHPDDDQQVLLSVSSYRVGSIFHTLDGGLTWEAIEGNLAGDDGPAVFDVAIYPTPYGGGDIYFAATSTGLYSTSELAGPNTIWKLEAANSIGNALVHRLAIRPADGTVAVATYGKGIYSISMSVTGVDETPQRSHAVLAQNYPNPFNPSTTIHYELPVSQQIQLSVFDLAGRRVRSLESGFVEAGPHDVEWDGRDDNGKRVASGMYHYRLTMKEFSETKRMVLVK